MNRLALTTEKTACWLMCTALSLVSATQIRADTVTVFAAASLKPAFDGIAEDFATETGHQLSMNFAGSALIARQIARGAPADVFVSANEQWMDYLVSTGRTHPTLAFQLASNRLALISSHAQDSGKEIAQIVSDLARADKVATGLVSAVPAGQYGKAALETLGLWSRVEPHLLQVDNVRAALTLVHLGEARLGVVYASDATSLPDVHLVSLFPEDAHPPIEYPVAAIGTSPSDATYAFLDFLRSDATQTTLLRFGFYPVAQ